MLIYYSAGKWNFLNVQKLRLMAAHGVKSCQFWSCSKTYSELESYILSLYPEHTKAIKCTAQKFKKMRHTLELIAEKLKHTDAPKTHLSVITLGDGNCCAYSLNITGFGNDSKHIQIRTKIVIENVINKEKYQNHKYRSQGAVQVWKDVTLPEIYSMF